VVGEAATPARDAGEGGRVIERVPPEWGDGGLARWLVSCSTCGTRDVRPGDVDGPDDSTCDCDPAVAPD
jgi:hypothetical protein